MSEIQFKHLEERVQALENLAREKELNQLKYPLDLNSVRAMKLATDQFLGDIILDTVWDDYFINTETFDADDSWDTTIVSGASVGWDAASDYIFNLVTSAVSGSSILVQKNIFGNKVLSFDKKQFFRVNFGVDSITNITAYLSINEDYGFKITNNALYGFINAGSEILTQSLQTLVADTSYKIEARLYPKDKVVFFVNDVQKSSLVVPSGLVGGHSNLWSLKLTANANEAKILNVDIHKLIQKL